jgi:hypothetical protein
MGGKAVSDEFARWRAGLMGIDPSSRRASFRGDVVCRGTLESDKDRVSMSEGEVTLLFDLCLCWPALPEEIFEFVECANWDAWSSSLISCDAIVPDPSATTFCLCGRPCSVDPDDSSPLREVLSPVAVRGLITERGSCAMDVVTVFARIQESGALGSA